MTRRRSNMNSEPTTLPAEVVPFVLLDVKQAAAFLGTTVNTLADWRTDGIGPPYVKIGYLVKYQCRDLHQWVQSRTVNPGGTKEGA
jgi:predicted DNA-binding transcriptional regulator AlpA